MATYRPALEIAGRSPILTVSAACPRPIIVSRPTRNISVVRNVIKLTPPKSNLCDEIDLDQGILDEQTGTADGRARRRRGEVALPHRVEAVEVGEVGEKDLRLDDPLQRRAGRLERLLQIAEDVLGLSLDV